MFRSMLAVVGLLLLAGCGSTAPTDPAAAPSAQSASSSEATPTATPTMDADTVRTCRAAANELGRNDVGKLILGAKASGELLPVAFATPLEKYRPIDAGSADPKVGAAVNNLNAAIADLNGTLFPDWTAKQVTKLLDAYVALDSWCLDKADVSLS